MGTYRNFLKYVKKLPNSQSIEKAIIDEVERVLKILQILPKNGEIKTIDDLCKVFSTPHHLKDKGNSLNYCAAKDHHFRGRGGLLFLSHSLNLPLSVSVTSKYKQSEDEISSHLQKFFKAYEGLFRGSKFLADIEFGTTKIIDQIRKQTVTNSSIPRYGNYKYSVNINSLPVIGHSLIETVLARLETTFHLEHPKCVGSESISAHLSICLLVSLFLTLFNLESKNSAHPHSFQLLRGKSF